ncbi:Probable RNA-directed DNA polymerase from transposon X-element [Eumeta japonica]|uniref:Probable RNA-directed DNA polymerase from transposon X-element n=1 Tax=Eumeta variegata TaxID=151549 RepID=A0A4C1UB62_EUMVA|nr:Probable RNA-directed DNA polymerase from transposon X-element [Eumeta japonica]
MTFNTYTASRSGTKPPSHPKTICLPSLSAVLKPIKSLKTKKAPYLDDINSKGVQLTLFAIDTALYYRARHKKSTLLHLQRAINELGPWFRTWKIEVGDDIRVFCLHAAPKALHRLQVIQNKFCIDATNAHWCVRNSILHRDLELPTIAKFMKDASKRFFDIVELHRNAFFRSAASYEPPQPYNFVRKPRNSLTNPPNALIAAVESLMEVNDSNN